jgi:hypothetical protein
MAYTITKTNGDTLVTVPDTELNTDFGISLVGRNYSGYGIFLNDNFISLLENFAKGTAPATPLEGQLWWNTDSMTLQVWEGNVWKKISHLTASGTAPTSSGRVVGDLWWDTTNQQLKAWAGEIISSVAATAATSTNYIVTLNSSDSVRVNDLVTTGNVVSANNVIVTQILSSVNVRVSTPVTIYSGEAVTFTRGSGWNLIGPSYTKDQQMTGVFPRTVIDSQNIERVVGLIYQKGQVIGSISRENEYIPRTADTIERLPVIKPGITLIEDSAPQFVRSVLLDTTGVNGNTVISVTQTEGLAVGDYVITDDIAYSALKTIQEIYGNGSIRINATTSLMTNDVVTFQRGTNQSNMFHGTVTNAQRLNGVTADRFAALDTDQQFLADVAVAGNLHVGRTELGVQKTRLWSENSNLHIINTQANGNISLRTLSTTVSVTPIEVLSVNGITGKIEVRGVPTSANGIATKSYVDAAQATSLAAVAANVTALINGASVDKRDFGNVAIILNSYASQFDGVTANLALKAPLEDPTFTGSPRSVTFSSATANTAIATTEYVTNAITTVTNAWTSNASTQASLIATKADIASPDFSGTPQVPHVSNEDRSRKVATTWFVGNVVDTAIAGATSSIGGLAPIASPNFTGGPTAPFAANLAYTITNNTDTSLGIVSSHPYPRLLATVGWVANAIATMPTANLQSYATKVNPTLEGVPRGTLAPEGTSNSWIATTQFVATRSPVLSVNGYNGVVSLGLSDISGAAPIFSPIFTGTPTLNADPDRNDSTLRIATTRWVSNIAANLAPQNSPTFIGTVTIPTPASNSNDTTATTTAWVRTKLASVDAIKWQGATKWVSTQAPTGSDGADGDIWFQYVP